MQRLPLRRECVATPAQSETSQNKRQHQTIIAIQLIKLEGTQRVRTHAGVLLLTLTLT